MKTEKIANILSHFRAILGTDQLVLTGSTVLELNGLFTPKDSTDLDILIVNPSAEAVQLLQRLQEASPAKTKPNTYSNTTLIAIIEFGGYKLDFFSERPMSDTLYCEALKSHVTSVGHIIKAKQQANRPKDWMQLSMIAENVYTDGKLKASLRAAYL